MIQKHKSPFCPVKILEKLGYKNRKLTSYRVSGQGYVKSQAMTTLHGKFAKVLAFRRINCT